MNQQIRLPLAGAALLILALGWQVSVILQLNQGIFTYTLDDPYIHLALAENIAAGRLIKAQPVPTSCRNGARNADTRRT
ncbi:MAG: hypothetical protein CML06_02970 [Pseudomonadales bacterium]|nr:hypothetical protein [Pseudomonadales bacterium]